MVLGDRDAWEYALPSNVDAKKIKAQYLRLAQKYHPDKGGCAEMFTKIRQAKVLLDKIY